MKDRGRRRSMSSLLTIVVTSIVLVFLLSGASAARLPPDDTATTVARLSSFVDLGTSYLTRVTHTATQDPNNVGKFTYIAYLNQELPVDFRGPPSEYNLLRHNGAIYSLGLSYHRQPNDEVLESMKRAVDFLKSKAIGPVPDSDAQITDDDNVYEKQPHIPNLLAAWETNAVTGDENGKPTAKLGGAGLALIALVSLNEILPGTTDLDYMRQLGSFIRYMQHDDGSFTCRYKPHKGGKDDSWTSLYYPGEAALGLLYLASVEDNDEYRNKWVETATKALLYLETLRRTQKLSHVEPDHWALLATARLLPLLDKTTSDYWRVYQHGVKVVQSMLSVLTSEELVQNRGCHTADGRTCPTATRLEGLLAALTFVEKDELFVVDWEPRVELLRDRMLYFIQLGVDFLLQSQQVDTSLNMQGGVPQRYPAKDDDSKEVRVDYVQHSMSAMIAYEQHLQSGMISNRHVRVGSIGSDTNWIMIGLVALVALVGVASFSSLRKPKKLRTQ